VSRESLLVVDERAEDRARLAGALRGAGFAVTEAGDGVDGLAALRATPADLVLCELDTTDADGAALLEVLTRDVPDVPVIVVTGEAGTADVVHALRLGAADYLTKPVADADVVVHAVDAALERARLKRENSRVKQELERANQQLREYVEELQQDQRAGRQVQLGMLPPSPMAIDGFRLQHRIVPSLFLSGDFVDYFRITDRHFVFFIADVSGHGASSAFVTVLLKNFSRRLRREYRPRMLNEPGEILRWLNQELLESHLDRHVTMFLGVVDCTEDRLAYANAGHFPAPALVAGEDARYLELPGKPLGLFPDLRLESASMDLPASFTLALFSDGVLEVTEAPDLAAKEAGILASVAASGTDLGALCERLGLIEGLEAPDDIACLLLTRST
jgi:serine phosphatase RsbU (regulator of sigma subunit)